MGRTGWAGTTRVAYRIKSTTTPIDGARRTPSVSFAAAAPRADWPTVIPLPADAQGLARQLHNQSNRSEVVSTMRTKLLVLALPLLVTACPREQPLTADEAQTSVEEASLATQAEGLTSASVDISTNFTIGGAVQTAAQELKTFIVSQLPCAAVTLSGATLTVQYGVNPGNCTYRGHQFTGTTIVSIERNDSGEVLVHHEWDALSNGHVEVTGSADVTWNLQAQTRHVVHHATWTNLSNGHSVVGSGDRTQSVLPGGLAEGIQVDGTRSWKSDRGQWDLAIDGVQMRWVDPVPQAGSYTLATPFDKSVTMSFSRVSDTTIQVTVESGSRSFHFNVTSTGTIQKT